VTSQIEDLGLGVGLHSAGHSLNGLEILLAAHRSSIIATDVGAIGNRNARGIGGKDTGLVRERESVRRWVGSGKGGKGGRNNGGSVLHFERKRLRIYL
jgi:hypothetical protein